MRMYLIIHESSVITNGNDLQNSHYIHKNEKKKFNIEIDQENYVDSHLSKLQRNFIFFLLEYSLIYKYVNKMNYVYEEKGLEKIYFVAHAIRIINLMFLSRYHQLQLLKKLHKMLIHVIISQQKRHLKVFNNVYV